MEPAPAVESRRLICPRCRTLNHLTSAQCFRPDCGETLSLLQNFGKCSEALQWRLTAERPARLQWHLRLRSPVGTLTLDLSPDQPLPTALPGWASTLEWTRDGFAVTVIRRTECCSHELPAEIVVEETQLHIWCDPEPPTGSIAVPLSPQPAGSWPLSVGVISIGRLARNHVAIPDPSVETEHALVWLMGSALEKTAWIVDRKTVSGTFVNRRRIDVARLNDGDFLQIASAGFVYSAADRQLQRVSPLPGAGLTLRNVTLNLPHAPQSLSLAIAPGEFVVFRGGSGAGKSTLAKAIVGQSECRRAGTMTLSAAGHHWRLDRDAEQYRQQIGYVPQDSILHQELSAEQARTHLCRLRLTTAAAIPAHDLFGRLGLPHDAMSRPIAQLSGGENKRVRAALELLHQPGLLVLDEPDSGLDAERQQQLFRMLRGLAYQGCTLIVVTHAPADVLRYADRVIVLDQAAVVFDGSPADYREWEQAGCPDTSPSSPAVMIDDPKPPIMVHQQSLGSGFWRHSRGLLLREAALWTASRRAALSRLVLPIGVVPCLFAAALALSVPRDQTGLLGFLSILSVIWMSASLSVGAISGERDIFEHERLLFLTTAPYLTAKFAATGLLSILQTTAFASTLFGLRTVLGSQTFHGGATTLSVLLATGGAAVALGLLLSALAGRRREVGTALLPFVILLQLVCSVAVAKQVNDSYEAAYGDFRLWPQESTRVQSMARFPTDRLVAALSQFTLSRTADEALRSFAYNASDYEKISQVHWRVRQSLLWLGFQGGVCWMLTGIVLSRPTHRL